MHLQLENLHKSYLDGEGRNLHIYEEWTCDWSDPARQLPSLVLLGTGKSTLLHLIGLLDQPDRGRVLLDDKDLSLLSRDAQARYRNTQLGFIFQFHQLLQGFQCAGERDDARIGSGTEPQSESQACD